MTSPSILPLLWWRAEVRSDGSVVSLVEVGAVEGPTKSVRYFQAFSREEAESIAKDYAAKYATRLAAERDYQSKRRQDHISRRVCPFCTEPALPGQQCCEKHHEARNAAVKRHQDRCEGIPVPKISTEHKRERIRGALQSRVDRIRRDAFLDVIGFAERAASTEAVVRWLRGEVAKLNAAIKGDS